ncbi:hypothetical protein BX600DRAFT_468848 [Xylariales sp. PMI_506]|nr:hypothetical protein BX600DRAFT_468848 [Xylariales sp. PMI_506]
MLYVLSMNPLLVTYLSPFDAASFILSSFFNASTNKILLNCRTTAHVLYTVQYIENLLLLSRGNPLVVLPAACNYSMVHTSLGGTVGHKLSQRRAQEALKYGDKDEAICDSTRTTIVDFGGDSQTETCSGYGRSGRETGQRENAEMALKLLEVTLLEMPVSSYDPNCKALASAARYSLFIMILLSMSTR